MQGVRFEPDDVATHALLRLEVALQHFEPGRRHDEEVAVLLEPDLRRLAVHRHCLSELLEERDAEVGELDVLGQAEEPANTARCPRRRGELVAGIPFDDRDTDTRLEQLEEVRDRSPDRAPSDHQDVCLHAGFSVPGAGTSDQSAVIVGL